MFVDLGTYQPNNDPVQQIREALRQMGRGTRADRATGLSSGLGGTFPGGVRAGLEDWAWREKSRRSGPLSELGTAEAVQAGNLAGGASLRASCQGRPYCFERISTVM